MHIPETWDVRVREHHQLAGVVARWSYVRKCRVGTVEVTFGEFGATGRSKEDMVASTALRERGFAEAKRLCYAGLDAPTLLREVAGRLRRVVPFETYCAFSNDPLSGLPTQLVYQGAIGPKQHRAYLEHVYFEEDLDGQRMMVQNRIPVALLSEATGGSSNAR